MYKYIIIGSGIAGLNFALHAAKQGKVLIITKKKLVDATTNYAQGGIASVLDQTDNFDKHIEDTLKAGSYHNKIGAVKYMVKNGPKAIQRLLEFGVPFESHQGKILLTKEGGHSKRRIAFVGDYTGKEIENTLVKQIRNNKNITIFQHTFALNLIVKYKRCYGVQVIKNSKIENIFSANTVLATGGLGQIYKHTTNPQISTGDGIGMAHRAKLNFKDLEFIQFHPTALNIKKNPKFLITEALRGEGAYLKNYKKQRFMHKYHKLKELAPRDIVAKAIYEEEKNGPVYLDITHKSPDEIKSRFPQIYKNLKKYDLDLTKDLIPITPAAHYSCGGVKTNLKGETEIKNLFAFGEVSWTGVHGANRLASNSLLEALVFSNRILENHNNSQSIKKIPYNKLMITTDTALAKKLKNEIKKIMWKKVGISRQASKLKEAKKQLQTILKIIPSDIINQELTEANNMATAGLLITKAAIKRKKSLGCHFIEL